MAPTWTGNHTHDGDIYLDNDNGIVIGDTNRQTSFLTHEAQIVGTSAEDAALGLYKYDASVSGRPQLHLVASQATNIGGNTAVSDGDMVGSLAMQADDGTDLDNRVVAIRGAVDAAVATDQVPGRIEFHTTDTAGSTVEALRINSGQQTLVSNGSESAPAISFVNQTNTGIYLNSPNEMALVTQGTQALRVDGSQVTHVEGGRLDIDSRAAGTAIDITVNGDVELGRNIIDADGNVIFDDGGKELRNIGGATAAENGEVRVVHTGSVRFRDAGDNNDILGVGVGNAVDDDIEVGTLGNYNTIQLGDSTGGKVEANAAVNLTGGGLERNGTTVVGPQESAIASLTDNTTGSTDGTLAEVSGSGADATINNNLAELNAKIDSLLTALRNHGLIAT